MIDLNEQVKKLVDGKMEVIVTELGQVSDVISAESDLAQTWATCEKKKKIHKKSACEVK